MKLIVKFVNKNWMLLKEENKDFRLTACEQKVDIDQFVRET